MRLAPANGNPFTARPSPLQEGRRLLAEGRVGDASLAFEAAVQVLILGKDQNPQPIYCSHSSPVTLCR